MLLFLHLNFCVCVCGVWIARQSKEQKKIGHQIEMERYCVDIVVVIIFVRAHRIFTSSHYYYYYTYIYKHSIHTLIAQATTTTTICLGI